MPEGIKVVFGGGSINDGRAFGDIELLHQVLNLLEKNGVQTIDTAALYGKSEELLGQASAVKRFTIDTKTKGGFNPQGGASFDNILTDAKNSKQMLGGDVDIYYIHGPDPNTPVEKTLAAIDEIHKSGFFKRFGLSNYKAADVQTIYDHCKAKGYVLPTAYQGNYSAIARKQEELLFPTLRKLGISFYAYSPLAGGFLTKTREQLAEGAGRFKKGTFMGDMYNEMYNKPSLVDALSLWADIAKEEGCSKADLAYRWVRYNSPLKNEQGDAIIVGAGSMDQLRETLDSINGGALSEKAVKGINDIWKKIEKDAPLDNYHRNSA